jgi:aminoglycoside 6'-N-acetyltransferase I
MTERIEAFKPEHLDECAHLFMTAFNAEPWNDEYTLDTAKKQLAWHLEVPGCEGLVSVNDGIVAFAIGYREPTDVRDVFHLSIFCVRPDVQRTRVGSRLMHTLEEVCARPGSGPSTSGPARERPPRHSTRSTATGRVLKTSR